MALHPIHAQETSLESTVIDAYRPLSHTPDAGRKASRPSEIPKTPEPEELIPSDLSHALLRRSIGLPTGGRRRHERFQPDAQAVARLRSIYLHYKPRAAAVPNAPRNLPFYLALRERYPDIGWEANTSASTNPMELPHFAGVDPSLAALLLQELPASQLRLGPRLPAELARLPPQLPPEMAALFETARVVLRRGEALRDFARVLAKGLAGETIHLLCPVCPDYAHVPTGKPKTPYRYTFSGVGEAPGLVAERLLEALPRFADFFARHGIDARFIIGQADFEVLSDATLQQVGVDATTFLSRLCAGGRAIESRTAGLPVRTCFLSELCGGLDGWRSLHASMHGRLDEIRRGQAAACRPIDWSSLLLARQPLYERWIGPQPCSDGYLPFLLAQGAEYAAIAELAHRHSANSLLLCSDHHAMTPFFKAMRDLPVIYLKRNYV